MSRNPHFDAYLEHMLEVHNTKNSDYSDDSNPYSNFEGTAELTGLTVEQVFHVQLGNKMERLRQLMFGKEPNHESLDDTILDIANYAALWGSWRNRPWYTTIAEPLDPDLDDCDPDEACFIPLDTLRNYMLDPITVDYIVGPSPPDDCGPDCECEGAAEDQWGLGQPSDEFMEGVRSNPDYYLPPYRGSKSWCGVADGSTPYGGYTPCDDPKCVYCYPRAEITD